MRIRSVRIHNLNSLRGHHHIDFTDEPLASAGIFAITGPTGSGKTTILDAITLALFHKISRSRELDVITRGTPEGFAEVEFEVNRRVYRAKYAQRLRKDSGEALKRPKSKAELSEQQPDGSFEFVGQQHVPAVRDRVSELLGLNYEQFSRSVILAQGEFSKFLKSTSNERSDLLERITGTEIYGRISTAVFERFREEERALQLLETELGALAVLSPEEVLRIRTALTESQTTAAAQRQTLNDLRECIAWRRELDRLERTQTDLDAQHRTLTAETERAAADLARLEQHERAQPFAEGLLRYDDTCQRGKEVRAQLDRLKVELPQREAAERDATATSERAKTALEHLKTEHQTAHRNINEAERLDALVARNQTTRAETHRRVQELQQKLTAERADLAARTQNIEQHRTDLEKASTFLGEHPRRAEMPERIAEWTTWQRDGVRLDEELRTLVQERQRTEQKRTETQQRLDRLLAADAPLARRLEQLHRTFSEVSEQPAGVPPSDALDVLRHREKQLHEQYERARQYAQLRERIGTQTDRRDRARTQLTKLERDRAQTDRQRTERIAELGPLRHRLETLELNYRVQQLSESVVQLRAQLRAEHPCPVCGSAHHPTEHAPPVAGANIRPKLEQTREQIKTLENQAVGLREQLRALDERILEARKNVAEETQTLESMEQELQSQFREVPTVDASERAALAERLRRAVELHRTLRQTQEERTENSTQLEPARERLRALDEQGQALLEKQQTLERTRRELHRQMARAATDYGLVFRETEGIAPLLKLAQRTQKCLDFQTQKTHELRVDEARRQQTQRTLTDLTARHTSTTEEWRKLVQEIAEQTAARTQLIGQEHPADARAAWDQRLRTAETNRQTAEQTLRSARETTQQLAARRDTLEQQYQTLRDRAKTLKAELDRQLAASDDFATRKDLRAARLETPNARRLTELRRDLNDRRTRLTAQRESNERARTELQTPVRTTEPLDELQRQHTALANERDATQTRIGTLRSQLDTDARTRQRSATLRATAQRQQTVFEHWRQMQHLIGSKGGQKFRNFAQTLTLQQLVHHANAQLRKLTDRYTLQTTGVESLALQIVDHHQAETVRGTETLSGGESFVVSLALALGLSALNAGRTRIDSLFIDEGFGTLDPQMLEVVITTLETLHGEGKTIGVISHVPALKERIGTQIRVRRLGQGMSTVEVV